jgi:glycosyltransferase involved in cell wall biosynthesis
MTPHLSVVVPVYNEEETVPHLADALHGACTALGRTYEIVLIDDGSHDATWDRLRDAASRYPHVRLIRFRRNFGQTAAMSAGFHASMGEVIVTLDADLQNDPADIGKLLEQTDKGFDVVSGWRKNRRDTFINRRLPSMVANAIISKITGVKLHDYGCTLKAYRREIVKNLKLYGEMHRFIPALASWVGGSLCEIPVTHHARRFGTSKYGISRTLRVMLDLMTVKFLLRYSAHPIQIFGKLGLWFGMPGILMLLLFVTAHIGYTFLGIVALGSIVEISKRPAWILTPFMLVLFCLQFISMGLLAEIQIRTYHESQDKPTYVVRETIEPDAAAK